MAEVCYLGLGGASGSSSHCPLFCGGQSIRAFTETRSFSTEEDEILENDGGAPQRLTEAEEEAPKRRTRAEPASTTGQTLNSLKLNNDGKISTSLSDIKAAAEGLGLSIG